MTIRELINKSAKQISWSPTPFLDVEIIIAKVLNKDRIYINTHDREIIPESIINNILKLIERREKHEPVAYIINEKEFYGRTFFVDDSVLIPRPETELLVDEGLEVIQENKIKTIIEIGTGSGCIITTLAKEIYERDSNYAEKIKFIATDISAKALEIAKENSERILEEAGITVDFIRSNLFDNLEKQKADLIISNPPYIPLGEYETLEKNVKDYEPELALVGGRSGTEIINKLLRDSKDYTGNGTTILLEIHCTQGEIVKSFASKYYSKSKVCIIKDYANLDRIARIEIN